jgi:phosphoglycerate kinase
MRAHTLQDVLCAAQDVELLLAEDVVCTHDLDSNTPCCVRPLTRGCCTADAPCIPADAFGADIGPTSRSHFVAALQDCRTIFWNGPMGKFEAPAYAGGT